MAGWPRPWRAGSTLPGALPRVVRPGMGRERSDGLAGRRSFDRQIGGDRDGIDEEVFADEVGGDSFDRNRLRGPDRRGAAGQNHEAAVAIAVVSPLWAGCGFVRHLVMGIADRSRPHVAMESDELGPRKGQNGE